MCLTAGKLIFRFISSQKFKGLSHRCITLNYSYLQAVFKQEEVDSSVICKQVLSDKAGEELKLIKNFQLKYVIYTILPTKFDNVSF